MSLGTYLKEASEQREHARNLRGKTRATCPKCGGSGESRPGRSERDAHGSYWVDSTPCLACGSSGAVEVPCTPEVEVAAIKVEIAKLQARLRDARKRGRAARRERV